MEYKNWSENDKWNEKHQKDDEKMKPQQLIALKALAMNRKFADGGAIDSDILSNNSTPDLGGSDIQGTNQPQRSPDMNGLMAQKSIPDMDNSSSPASSMLSDDDKAAVAGYVNDQDAAFKAKQAAFEKMKQISPEEMEKYQSMMMPGMGSIENIAAKEAMPLVESGLQKVFPKIQKYFTAGDISFPAENTAQALKIKEALQNANKIGQNRDLIGPFFK